MTIFADINNDGLTDILFADAGSDAEPFPGSRIGVALNVGGGKYRDVSSLIPADQQTTRSYAIAVGDIFGDGRVEIILPDQNRGTNTALLRWNGTGFDEIRNWIPQSIWTRRACVAERAELDEPRGFRPRRQTGSARHGSADATLTFRSCSEGPAASRPARSSSCRTGPSDT